jgi:DNA polymerase III delta prime subunit|uniref:AAA+ ATPase domain-containing protein n=1 Tax=viral metagenome TaxID=1070528 RepID=A0A6C0IT75_9ZZZZ
MESIDINTIFERNDIKNQIKSVLMEFEEKCHNVTYKKGIYLYGSPGTGKTYFITELLKELNYDIIKYDAGDIRNKNLIETITSDNVSNRNVLDMMTRKQKKIAIVMDEIDGMNSGDKGGINALIKLIRQKKTKKQKSENKTMNPIICIGNYYTDKKMRELMKVCNVFELPSPKGCHVKNVFDAIGKGGHLLKKTELDAIIAYVQGDMCKLKFAVDIVQKKINGTNNCDILSMFHTKSFNEDAKTITKQLLGNNYPIDKHCTLMNDTDRTIVALLWHENIIEMLTHIPSAQGYPLYYKILRNICFADYIDRITFQNQIWQFNEMSSLIKTFYNNNIFHIHTNSHSLPPPDDIRFTKVLTKYSTEYNNSLFMQDLSQRLSMDKRDIISLFQEIRLCIGKDFINDTEILVNLEKIFEPYEINKLDIRRMYRYLDKNTKKEVTIDELEDDT